MKMNNEDEGRAFFPRMLTSMDLLGRGVEVGVLDGKHAKIILDNWEGKHFYGVDPFMDPTATRNHQKVKVYQLEDSDWENVMRNAQQTLEPYKHRATLMVLDSVTASQQFHDGVLDWVYLDGRHHYDGVIEDIQVWIPKIRKGGVMAGHDYSGHEHNHAKKTCIDVRRAVDEFFGDMVQTYDSGTIKSWYVLL